jgi:hypothetical protein
MTISRGGHAGVNVCTGEGTDLEEPRLMICLFSRPLLPSKERVRARFHMQERDRVHSLACHQQTRNVSVEERCGLYYRGRQYIQMISSVHPTAQNLRTNEHPSIPKVTRRELLGTSIAHAIPRGGTMYIISLCYPLAPHRY